MAISAFSAAQAIDLRIYPSFAEVRQSLSLKAVPDGGAALELPFSTAGWNWIQPSSLSWSGSTLTRVHLLPGISAWLKSQEGQPVTLLRAGMTPLRGVLVRAADLLVKLNSGEFLNVQASELAFAQQPPRDWANGEVRLRLEANSAQSGVLSYRTRGLSWAARYELLAAESQAKFSALADIRNASNETFKAENVDLYAGDVRQPQNSGYAAQNGVSQQAAVGAGAVPVIPGADGSSNIASLGEMRGLQRYALTGSLKLMPLETLTLPFLQPKLSNFARYEQITAYFQTTEAAGSANRHYKLTPDLSMPMGTVDVREDGALVGSVQLSATQAGRGIDLDLGRDPELRFIRSVKRLSQEKNGAGKILNTTYQVTYTLTSSKALPVRVQVREQVYARAVVVDAGTPQAGQVNVTRAVDVPAGGKASITFKLKLADQPG